ncbi:MAG: HAD hydrolase-like protein [Elusimicrobiales bacterium]|nr:HAD hydrolase-like protein [Elusimicrobiales bacterium]
MKAKIILFDIDGTLIKAGSAGTRSLNMAIEKLFGVKNICDTFSLQGCTDKTNFESAFINACGKKPSKKDIENITAEYLRLLPSQVSKSVKKGIYKKVKGINKLLSLLSKQKDVFIGLGTGNIKDGAFLKLKPSGLLKFFSFGGYGCDCHIRSNVLIKGVKRAEKLTGEKFAPKNVYIIGDTHKDIIAAKEAGYHSGIVFDGFGDKKLIMKNSPELIADDFSNLTPWLIWLGLKRDPKGIRRGTYVCPDTPIEHAHFGMTGMDLGDAELRLKKLRKIKNNK